MFVQSLAQLLIGKLLNNFASHFVSHASRFDWLEHSSCFIINLILSALGAMNFENVLFMERSIRLSICFGLFKSRPDFRDSVKLFGIHCFTVDHSDIQLCRMLQFLISIIFF